MTTKLKIGSGFNVPPEIMTYTSAVLGVRGSGKTNTGVVFVEELLKMGAQVVVIDPTDVWYGLKSSADGKKEGHKVVVLGGEHSDLPLDATDGAIIADFLVDNRAPAILSLRHMRKNEQRKFVLDFASQTYFRKGPQEFRTPLLIVIDECDTYIPQHVTGDVAKLVGAIEDLVRKGRASGIGVMLISQRAASVNKHVLTQIELLISHRHTSPQDSKALDAWIQQHDTVGLRDEFLSNLASLKVGEAYFWSPGWLDVFKKVQVRHRETFDSSATPKLGATLVGPQKKADVDLESLRMKLEKTITDAAENDPKALKARIRQLENEVARAEKGAPAANCGHEKIITELQRQVAYRDSIIEKSKRNLEEIDGCAKVVEVHFGKRPEPFIPEVTKLPKTEIPVMKEPVTSAATPKLNGDGDVKLTGPQLRILRAAYWIKDDIVITPSKLAFYANYTAGGGAFNNPLSALRTLGYISGYEITPEGIAALPANVEPKPTGPELREWFRPKLKGPENKILDFLLELGGQRIDPDELAVHTGYTPGGGAFNNPLSRLRSLEIAEGGKGEGIKISDVFLEAR